MKTRTGTLQKTASGYRARIRVGGKSLYFPLVAKDEEAALVEMKDHADRLAGKTTASVADALRGALARVEQSPVHGGTPMADVWGKFVASRKRRPSKEVTMHYNKAMLDAFRDWASKAAALEDVTEHMAHGYVTHLDDLGTMSADTINKHVATLRSIWKVLAPRHNPWIGIQSSRGDDVRLRHQPFTDDQIKAILNTAPESIRDVLWILAYTGLRLADVCLLQVGSIFLSRGVIELVPMKMSRRDKSAMTAKVGIHDAIRPILKRCLDRRVSGDVFPDIARLYRRDNSSVSKLIQMHLAGCGIETSVRVRGRAVAVYGAHSFRHTVQTMLTNAMVHPLVIDVVLAHKSGGMGNTYTHVSDSQVIEAVGKLPDWHATVGQVIEMRQA